MLRLILSLMLLTWNVSELDTRRALASRKVELALRELPSTRTVILTPMKPPRTPWALYWLSSAQSSHHCLVSLRSTSYFCVLWSRHRPLPSSHARLSQRCRQ